MLSTALATWNIYREMTNRGRLRVTITLANVYAPGVGIIDKDKLWYKVTNEGRRPIWLQQIGGALRDGHEFLLTPSRQLPVELEPGEAFDECTADALQVDPDEVTFMGAWDTRLRKLKEERAAGGGR